MFCLTLWSLFISEVKRLLKVGIHTVLGPAISSLLFLAVFSLALGKSVSSINGTNLENFIAPGLIMMTMLQNSFANSASSIGQAKFQGNIVDILMSPLNLFFNDSTSELRLSSSIKSILFRANHFTFCINFES